MAERNFIGYGKQWIDNADIRAVVDTLNSNYLTQGSKVSEFEEILCEITGAKYCVAVANGTAALHLSVAALDLPQSSIGITSPITFCATSNSLIYNGLIPEFADIEINSGLIDSKEIENKISKRTKVLLPVHYAGQLCDMEEIYRIAEERGLNIIEDAAHAIGGRYPCGSSVGSCKYSDIAIFSFHPVKTMTTGEGGAITTNNKELYERLKLLRNHGITKDENILENNHGPWYYEMHKLGFNYRITDLQCALGISQLKKLEMFVEKRRDIVDKYDRAFSGIDWIETLQENPDTQTARHLYVIKVNFKKIGKSRAEVMNYLKERNIGTQVHYIPVHLQPYYQKNFGFKKGDFPKAEIFYEQALSIPLFPKMSEKDLNYVINSIISIK